MHCAAVRLARLAVPCLTLLAAGFASRVHAGEYIKSYSVTGHASVRVSSDDGSVHVSTSDSPQVQFHVTYQGLELGSDLHVDSRQEGAHVELTARIARGIAFGIRHRRVSIDVLMPGAADLEVETGDGSVELSSMSGAIMIVSGDGSITASQLSGTIALRTRDGGISADTLAGDLRLHTGDGRIDAVNLDGTCEAASGDGSIHLAGRFTELDVKSGDGAVVARVAAGSRMAASWNIATGDGSVDLALPADFKADLDASTGDGHISLNLPVAVQGDISASRVRGAMNGGGPELFIRSGDGSIHLNRSPP